MAGICRILNSKISAPRKTFSTAAIEVDAIRRSEIKVKSWFLIEPFDHKSTKAVQNSPLDQLGKPSERESTRTWTRSGALTAVAEATDLAIRNRCGETQRTVMYVPSCEHIYTEGWEHDVPGLIVRRRRRPSSRPETLRRDPSRRRRPLTESIPTPSIRCIPTSILTHRCRLGLGALRGRAIRACPRRRRNRQGTTPRGRAIRAIVEGLLRVVGLSERASGGVAIVEGLLRDVPDGRLDIDFRSDPGITEPNIEFLKTQSP